jgi:hypothetical protein
MQSSDQSDDDFLTKRLLAQRYKRNPKTIERWTASGVLPEPDMIVAKQPYWKRRTIEQNERERMPLREGAQAVVPMPKEAVAS